MRQWFRHDPTKWGEFQRRYRRELAAHEAVVIEFAALADAGTLTLVFAASDRKHNNAVALAAAVATRSQPSRPRSRR